MYDCSANQMKQDMDKLAVSFLNACINSKYTILLPAIVVSEIINRIYREEYKKQRQKYTDFKEFRSSSAGRETLQDIQQVLSPQIYRFQQKGYIENVDDGFESLSLETIISHMDALDFNDFILANICEANSATLVTNDSDFKAVRDRINIITTRPFGL